MEVALSFLERATVFGVGVFALYLCFQVGNKGLFAHPAVWWTARVCLFVLAAVCFFAVAQILGMR